MAGTAPAHTYYRSQNILSGWEKVGNPAKNDTGKCFDTQVTYIIPIDAPAGKFIYMGDRWNGNKFVRQPYCLAALTGRCHFPYYCDSESHQLEDQKNWKI